MSKKNKAKAPKPYFSVSYNYAEGTSDVESVDFWIFGDIASQRGGLSGLLAPSSDQDSYTFTNQLANVPAGVPVTVHINSYGGEVSEGLAIYNTIKTRGGVTTICEGFAASAASLIFCAGDRRIMQPASLLFIHQASVSAEGNSDELQKVAEDLRTITTAAANAYREAGVNVSDQELSDMMKAETWILPEDALRMGFATEIANAEPEVEGTEAPMNDAMRALMSAVAPKIKPRPADSTFGVDIDTTKLDGFTAELEKVNSSLSKYEDLLALANKALDAFEKDPQLYEAAKAFVLKFATSPAPVPAKGGNRGFFNL